MHTVVAVSWVLVAFLIGLARGQSYGDVRINTKGYTNRNGGVVEVYFNGEWGLVCDSEYWNIDAASVVCRQAGFAAAINVVAPDSYYDPTLDPLQKIWLNDYYCNGDESNLVECIERLPTTSLASCPGYISNIAAVLCADVRLVDTSDDGYTGQVEVYNEGHWYGICSERWGSNAADVVCNMLFPWEMSNVQSSVVQLESVPLDKAVFSVACSGWEETLHECRAYFDILVNCGTRAAVSCVGDKKREMDLNDDLKSRAVQLLLQLLQDKK